jgi:predicted RNase H-related nuclease YkuK (DUF458 family)
MHDVVLVQDLESFYDLRKVSQCDSLRKGPMLFEETFKATSIAKLVDEVVIIGSFEHVDILDDVLGGFEVGEDVDFIE